MRVLPEPAYPITAAKSSRASMCSRRLLQARLFRGPRQLREAPAPRPPVTRPYLCRTPLQKSCPCSQTGRSPRPPGATSWPQLP